MEDPQKKEFEKFCFLENDLKGSKTISREKANKVIMYLKKDPTADYSPKFKHWVKMRKFQLVTYTAFGLHDVLCLPAKSEVLFLPFYRLFRLY